MFDFVMVKKSIINDLNQICAQNYLILKELNFLPKELNLIIAHNRRKISDELIALNEDIEYSYKDCLFKLINRSIAYNIDIFEKYDQYLKDLPNVRYWDKKHIIYNPKNKSPQNRCINILYSLDSDIFYKLLVDYFSGSTSSCKYYEYHYDRNLGIYINTMNWKTNIKYIKLLDIINLDDFLRFIC
jgi:hypothetical protein